MTHPSASDSFATLALYKFIYLLKLLTFSAYRILCQYCFSHEKFSSVQRINRKCNRTSHKTTVRPTTNSNQYENFRELVAYMIWLPFLQCQLITYFLSTRSLQASRRYCNESGNIFSYISSETGRIWTKPCRGMVKIN